MSEPRCPTWKIRRGRIFTPAPFLVAGIVNITPDSFSDGGRYAEHEDAIARVRQMMAEGVHMVDLGAESTRPGARDIGPDEEWRRLEPVLEKTLALRDDAEKAKSESDVPVFAVSIDSFRAATAARAAEAGADVINDVSGASFDPAMAEVLAQYQPGYVLGHSPARPDTMQQSPRYDNVVEELLRWFESRMALLVSRGLPEECICLDPCIGFGKTLAHTLDIIAAIPRFAALGRPLYFGISRKSFLGEITGLPVNERGGATQAATALLARAGVQIHRVHDTAETLATLAVVRAWPAPAV